MKNSRRQSEKFSFNPEEPEKRADMLRRREEAAGGFVCGNEECKGWVPISPEMGVNNRNHCPHCLWSKHMDENTSGDRASTCGSRMKPIGLAFKRDYGRVGELSVIHQCLGPDHKLSVNRIAADDNTFALEKAFEASVGMPAELRTQLEQKEVHVLGEKDLDEFKAQLFGRV